VVVQAFLEQARNVDHALFRVLEIHKFLNMSLTKNLAEDLSIALMRACKLDFSLALQLWNRTKF
jgi:hypothetical protein